MLQVGVLLVCFLLADRTAAAAKQAKNYFTICKLSDPEIDDCIKNVVQTMRPTFKKGIPDLRIEPVDPLFVPKIEFGDGTGNFKIHQTLSNLRIYGLSNYTITDLHFDPQKWEMNFTFFNPNLDFEGDYDLKGQILVVPVDGEGKATFNFTDVITRHSVKLEEFDKKGQKYLRVKNYKLSIEPKHAQSYFTNLFKGDKALGENTNKFFNDNWRAAFETYKSLPEAAFSKYLQALVNRVYSLFPKDELFPK